MSRLRKEMRLRECNLTHVCACIYIYIYIYIYIVYRCIAFNGIYIYRMTVADISININTSRMQFRSLQWLQHTWVRIVLNRKSSPQINHFWHFEALRIAFFFEIKLVFIPVLYRVLGMTLNCIHVFINAGSFLYWCVMRPASQRFFIHSCIYLRILIISYLATFLSTNSLSVLMCRKTDNKSCALSALHSTLARTHAFTHTHTNGSIPHL